MRFALRQLAKSPGFMFTALVTLALGIGVNTTAFTALNRLLLQALPFREPERLVQIWGTSPRNDFGGISPGDYFDLRDDNTVFEDVTAYVPYASDSLAEPGQPAAYLSTIHSTANFFRIFGIQPQLGRTFTPDEEKHMADVGLVSNSYWHEHYGADPKVLGRTVRLNAKTVTIVGVLPARLDDPTLFDRRISFWLLDPTAINHDLRYLNWYRVAARLKPGVTLHQAQANLLSIGRRLAHDFPKTNSKRGFRATAYPPNNMGDIGSQTTWLVMVLSGLVLVIACVNLANLQLVRTTRRSQEIAIRLALGSSRARVVWMLLQESLILSLGGALLALLVGKWSNMYVAKYFGIDMPLDLRVIGFTFAASALTGAAFGAFPAWTASREDLSSALKESGRGSTAGAARHWFRQGLVVLELVLALTVLGGAAYFVSGIFKLTHQDLGWTADHTLIGEITLDHDHYGEQKDPRSVAFGDRLVEVLQALPGVKRAATGQGFPAYGGGDTPYRVEGQPAPEQGHEEYAASLNIGPGYLGIYGISIVKGRDFNERDRPGSTPVVIINEAMAKKCWPGADPIGKRLGGADPANPEWAEVVGVMKDFHGVFDVMFGNSGRLKMYRPWAQNSHRFVTFHIRTAGPPEALEESVRRAVATIIQDIALSDLGLGSTVIEANLSYFTFLRKALMELSALALLLSAVGIYGVVATLVSERTKEIGIRMALGAQSGSLIWLFLRNGLFLSITGAVAGAAAAYALIRILTRMLPFLPGFNAWYLAPVAVFLVAVALVACWLPARRSTRVNPTISLRSE
jgi:putative ABC transport system permease protein